MRDGGPHGWQGWSQTQPFSSKYVAHTSAQKTWSSPQATDPPTVPPAPLPAASACTGRSPADVTRQLQDAALMFANVLSRLGDDWDRTLMYNYPRLTERSLRWTAVHTLHEVRHHLLDIERQLPGAGRGALRCSGPGERWRSARCLMPSICLRMKRKSPKSKRAQNG